MTLRALKLFFRFSTPYYPRRTSSNIASENSSDSKWEKCMESYRFDERNLDSRGLNIYRIHRCNT